MAKPSVRKGTKAIRREFPAHLATSPDEWRIQKRQQWREVMQAIERYNWGAAYTPGTHALYHLHKLAHQVSEEIERHDWVAW